MAISPFFVRRITDDGVDYVDLESGLIAEPLDVSYEVADEGLCKKYGRPVYKKRFNDGFPPLVLIAKEPPKVFRYKNPIKTYFNTADRERKLWKFSPYELEELSLGLEEGLSVHQLAVRLGAPMQALENLLEKLGGESIGIKRCRAERERPANRVGLTARR
jgi:hypothetical protein